MPKNFTRLILLDRFWFVYIPFDSIVKIQSLAQFPVNHLSHPVMLTLVLLLHLFATFIYYDINDFIYFLT